MMIAAVYKIIADDRIYDDHDPWYPESQLHFRVNFKQGDAAKDQSHYHHVVNNIFNQSLIHVWIKGNCSTSCTGSQRE